ncbi:MAG: MarR family transcriptional regulator [Ruminococcaceae bacterium]|nr:MarR family transcriptional regulator [Oscillospiraceae bacterium]
MKNENKALENGVVSPLALIRWVSSEYEELITKETEGHKILNQKAVRSVLKILTINNGISQNELAREVHLQGSTISVALVKMEEEGLIRREASSNDKRKVNVYMTSSGYEMIKTLDKVIDKMEEKMLDGLTDSEKYDLHYYLTKILKNC